MMNLLFEYRFMIILVLAVMLYAVLEWQKFKTISYALMLQAKSKAKNLILKSGKQQEDWVVNKAYLFLPKKLTIFINQERMRRIIHFLYVKAKDKIDDGEINNSIE